MTGCKFSQPLLIILHLVGSLVLCTNADQYSRSERRHRPFNNSIPAIYVFGDSTVDPGNNNYINTLFKCNFPPYGRDFVNHIPTGRFSNVRLVTDFIASYVGVKDYIPPYLDPMLSNEELTTGVSFASASSGFDPLTSLLSGVIPIEKQVRYFRDYKAKIELAIGKESAKTLIEKAAFVVSCGTNDLAITYFGGPLRAQSYTLSAYLQFLIQNIQHFIEELLDEGARTIAFVGMPPIGCLPSIITLHSDNAFHHRTCIETLSSASRDYNQLLQETLKVIQTRTGASILYGDIYSQFSDLVKSNNKYGFDEVSIGCCGTGFLEAAILCNTESPVCGDPSKYVFWDSVHPTERSYYIIFESLRPTIDKFLKQTQ